jgi:pimeloyl-ACP methyl ester carboxylesterase
MIGEQGHVAERFGGSDPDGSMNLHVGDPTGHGPALVLLHGVTRCGQDWRIVLPTLDRLGTIVALDLRGHGSSPRARNGYRVIDYVADVIGAFRDLAAPVVLVGHSLGAMVAAAVAGAVPELVRGLVLEDPTFEMTGRRIGETSFLDLFQAYRPFAGSRSPTAEVARALGDRMVRTPDGRGRVPLNAVRDPGTLRFIASCLKRLDPAVLTPIIEGRWLEGYDVDGALAQIRCPTLFLQADHAAGGALPDDYARDLAGGIADAALVKLSGVGHNIHTSQPEAMMRVVVPFLLSLDEA